MSAYEKMEKEALISQIVKNLKRMPLDQLQRLLWNISKRS